MSTQLAKLSVHLVRHFYGDLPADIFATLLDKGRVRLIDISVALKLSTKSVKNGLSVLAQQNLLLFHPTNTVGHTFYEPNTAQSYAIIRYGKHTSIVGNRLGSDAAEIVGTVQGLGCATAEELSAQGVDGHKQSHPVNGDAQPNGVLKEGANGATSNTSLTPDSTTLNGHVNPRKRTRAYQEDSDSEMPHDEHDASGRKMATRTLISRNFLEKLRPYTYIPPTDFDLIVQEHVRKSDPRFRDSISGPKKSDLFRGAVALHKESILDGMEPMPKDENDSGSDEESAPTAKKRKLNGKEAVPVHRQPDFYRFNPEKALIAMRSDMLTTFVHMRLGESFAKVYHRLLRCLEDSKQTTGAPYALTAAKKMKYRPHTESLLPSMHPDDEDDDDGEGDATNLPDEDFGSESTSVIARKLTDAEATLISKHLSYIYVDDDDEQDETRVKADGKGKQRAEKANPTAKRLRDERAKLEQRESDVEKCLRIIADSSVNFVEEAGEEGANEWTVRIDQLVRTLVQEELEKVVEARFGPIAKRIIRMLHANGKLDEKALSNMGLIKQRDVRALLTQLQTARYVDIQELPRDNSRQPNRTIYLWYFDQERCRNAVVDDIYKAMSRLLERHAHEREKVRGTLDKAARTDVQGHEDKFLNQAERKALEEWRAMERKIFLALSRHDDLVFILRDLLSPPLTKDPTT